jgi:uncharacterized DUF497 family protein
MQTLSLDYRILPPSHHHLQFATYRALYPNGVRKPVAISIRLLYSQEEDRWFTLGASSDGRLLAVAHIFEEQSDSAPATARIISARTATRREREQYENEPR